jgi:transcriptional regulator with XRE-family HTH domain
MLGERLRALRKQKRITQEQLGRILGVGKAAVSQYEKGTRKPDAEMLRRISGYFHVSTDYLLGLENQVAKKGAARECADLPPEARQMLKEYENFLYHRYGRNNCGSTLDTSDPKLREFIEEYARRDDLQQLYQQIKPLSPKAVQRIASFIQVIKEELEATDS